MRCLPWLMLLGCTSAPESVPSETPGPNIEPVGIGTLYQGIQIGEGGDAVPCVAVLTPSAEVVERPEGLVDERTFLASIDGVYPDLAYVIGDQEGRMTLSQVPDAAAHLLTEEPLDTAAPGDCLRVAWVVGLHVAMDDLDASFDAVGFDDGQGGWAWQASVPRDTLGLGPSEVDTGQGTGAVTVLAWSSADGVQGTVEQPVQTTVGSFGP